MNEVLNALRHGETFSAVCAKYIPKYGSTLIFEAKAQYDAECADPDYESD